MFVYMSAAAHAPQMVTLCCVHLPMCDQGLCSCMLHICVYGLAGGTACRLLF